jgi:hypothetical protein
MYVCIFIRLTYLQVTRNMVLFMLFTHTTTFIVDGISLIGYAYMTHLPAPHTRPTNTRSSSTRTRQGWTLPPWNGLIIQALFRIAFFEDNDASPVPHAQSDAVKAAHSELANFAAP